MEKRELSLDMTTVHRCTHTHIHAHTWGQFNEASPPTSVFKRGWIKLENPNKNPH